jgi:trehalose/maltose hydrolase-like predicted phosphorylase
MDSVIPPILMQQLWWVLIQLLWLQPEQERNLLEYRTAIRKADENSLNPGYQTELFDWVDIMQHMASSPSKQENDHTLTHQRGTGKK